MSTTLNPAYAEIFERFAQRLPAVERMQRRALFDSFVVGGFPGPAREDWHYTDLAPLAETAFQPADGDSDQLLVSPVADTDRLVYVDGKASVRYSTARALDQPVRAPFTGEDGLDALNAAYAQRGLVLKLAPGERQRRPLVALLQSVGGQQPTMTHQRHRIEVGPQAEATVLLHFAGQGGPRLSTHVFDVRLGHGAHLNLHRLSDEAEGATLVTRLDLRLARDARLWLSATDVGAGLARHFTGVTLAEPGAEVEAHALYVPKTGAHVDNQMRIVHAAPHCRSRLHGRGIVDAHAKAVFRGCVVVQPGAQKTDSEQRLANLLLSRKAEINAKPDLEIHADDVKCAHGCTVGQLDEKALGYLRSRGIPRDQARALLLRAFVTGILDRFEWPALRERIEARLHLPTLAADEVIDWEDAA